MNLYTCEDQTIPVCFPSTNKNEIQTDEDYPSTDNNAVVVDAAAIVVEAHDEKEVNHTMLNDLPPRNDQDRHGASVAASVEVALKNSYVLVETTLYSVFLVERRLYLAHFSDLVPDTRINTLHEVTMGMLLYQLYDGSLKLWGLQETSVAPYPIPMEEKKIQMLRTSLLQQRNRFNNYRKCALIEPC